MELNIMKRSSSELKQMARGTLIGRYSLPICAYLVTYAISIALEAILGIVFPFSENTAAYVTYLIASFICSLLLVVLKAGPTTILLDMSRGGRGQMKDVFYAFTHQPDRILLSQLLISLIGFACVLPGILLYAACSFWQLSLFFKILSLLLFAAGIVLSIYLMLSYVLVVPLYIDCPQTGALELLRESRILMKGNKGRYFYMELSFLGIALLGTLSCFIGLLWVIPYAEMTALEFYREIVGEI